MNTTDFKNGLEVLGAFGRNMFHDNKAHIFTALSMAGTIATGVVSAKDGAKAARRIDREEYILGRELTGKEKFKLCWKDYIDAGLLCVGSCAATVASDAINTRTIADRTTLLIATEKAYEKLSKKTKDVLGEKKHKEVIDEVAKDKVITAKPEMFSEETFAKAPRTGDGTLYPFIDGYSMLPFWSNLNYIDLWVMKLNDMMGDIAPRNRVNNYNTQKIGVPYSEWLCAIGYDSKVYNTPERKNCGWNKGYAKDGSDDDPIQYFRTTMEYSPGFAVTVITWEKDPTDMTLGNLIKENVF